MADTSKDIVEATQVVDCGDPSRLFTFANDGYSGTGSVFYMKRNTAVTLVGTGAEIAALGASELKVGGRVVVPGVAYDVVCGSDTGVKATMRVLDGAVSASNATAATGAGAQNTGTIRNVAATDSPDVTAIDNLIKYLSPTLSTGLTAIAAANDEWTSVTLGANTLELHVTPTGGNAYYVCQTATPADADTGAIMYANITIAVKSRGRTKFWFRNHAIGTNVTAHITDNNHA